MNQTVISILRYLTQLEKLVEKMEAESTAYPQLLHTRLYEDMLPCFQQVCITNSFALRAICALADKKVISFNNEDYSFSGLKHQVAETRAYLAAIPESDFNFSDDNPIEENAGFSQLSLSKTEYFYQYAVPNFFFHLSMVYANARSIGIALSKGDFDGFHGYPPGFSFENPVEQAQA